ncbi:OsmC family protein [Cytophagaceae bacterium ABcell3]|nr:OsmC family protein [Cytophagaceae bacterium ABcell3]
MLIELSQKDGFHFEALNESEQIVHIDASPAIGGQNKGARPMELLIMGLGGCSAIDVINILKKQKIEVQGMRIRINADRDPEAVPSLFTNIHVEFILPATVDKQKAERAAALSMDKYCSVAKTLEKTAKITYTTHFE